MRAPAPKFMLGRAALAHLNHNSTLALDADTRAATSTRHCPPPSSAPPFPAGTATGRVVPRRPAHRKPADWVQRLVIRGRKRELGLGSTALVSLAEARDRGLSNRKVARKGGDPLADKRRAEAMPIFADATPAWSSRSGPAGAAQSTPGPG